MTNRYERSCKEIGCQNFTGFWRLCIDEECKHEIAYCDDHGGDMKSEHEMAQHIQTSHYWKQVEVHQG